jgi:hypothetical protein
VARTQCAARGAAGRAGVVAEVVAPGQGLIGIKAEHWQGIPIKI